jgi:hypothetical protein
MLNMAFWKKSEPGFSWNKLKSWKLFHETKNDSQIIFFDFVGYKDFLYNAFLIVLSEGMIFAFGLMKHLETKWIAFLKTKNIGTFKVALSSIESNATFRFVSCQNSFSFLFILTSVTHKPFRKTFQRQNPFTFHFLCLCDIFNKKIGL